MSKRSLIPEKSQLRKSDLTLSKTFQDALDGLIKDAKRTFDNLVLSHGSRISNGCIVANVSYKRVQVGNANIGIHTLSFLLFNDISVQIIQDEQYVIRHKCGNNKCFEPTHLEVGTSSQNLYDDKVRDGTMINGEKHHKASITEEIAKQIIASKLTKGDSQYQTLKQRAERFEVSERLIQHIDAGHSWGHLQ